MLSPDVLVERLKDNAHPRVCKSLDKLHEILNEYFKEKGKDYRYATIGRLSEKKGGPGYSSIKNTGNQHYRDLINAWSEKAGTELGKPELAKNKHRIASDEELLMRIKDPALRAVFGQILSDRARYRRQVRVLQEGKIPVDNRPTPPPAPKQKTGDSPSPSGVLSKSEIEALRTFLSKEYLAEKCLEIKKTGQVKSTDWNDEVAPRGFTKAIAKILALIDEE